MFRQLKCLYMHYIFYKVLKLYKCLNILYTLLYRVQYAREGFYMRPIPLSDVRAQFTDLTQKTQFLREPYILTRNNKPVVGLVPVEYLMMLFEVLKVAKKSNDLSAIIEKYLLVIDHEEIEKLQEYLENPPMANKRLQASVRAAKRKFQK